MWNLGRICFKRDWFLVLVVFEFLGKRRIKNYLWVIMGIIILIKVK